MRKWLAPLPLDWLIGLLGELYLKTVRRGEGGEDREGLFRLYARELQAYPGDVVRDAINGYRGTFFPALAELQGEIEQDRRIRERRLRIKALRAFLNGEQDEERQGPPPTDEQIKRMRGHFAPNWAPQFSEETLERLAEVDRVHGSKARAKMKTGDAP